jgi:cysteine synthase
VLYQNILDTIGDTPVIKLQRMAPAGVNLYVKLESFNPSGSVKDRMARAVIEHAEKTGELKPGQTIVEATSGNTGIGLAMVCAQKGYPLVIVMAESFSVERRKLMRFFGAKVVLTPAAEKGTGMVKKAEELAREHGWWQPKQFENPVNSQIHEQTTAVEILNDFRELGLDYLVAGFGTSGTLSGVSRVLKAESPATRIVACEPDNSPVLANAQLQPRDEQGKALGSHPLFRPHLMQGWAPDFVPPLIEPAIADGLIDQIVGVNGEVALETTKLLAQKEGILVGVTSGAALAAALEVAEKASPDSTILCMLADTGERYLSTPLFAHIQADMDASESAISMSTANYRFDRTAKAPVAMTPVIPDPAIQDRVQSEISANEVVMYALEWCEFCWSVRKLFEKLGVEYCSVDLDSVTYQQGNLGGEIRKVLTADFGIATLPVVFIKGQLIGGCSETFDAYKNGQLASLLTRPLADLEEGFDPYSLLPDWLHSR